MSNATVSLVAVFDNVSSAEDAKRDLVREGFNEQEIQFTSMGSFTSDAASGNAALTRSTTAYSADHGMGGWFRSMFSFDNEESGYYYTAARQKGGSAISLHTDEARVDRAVSILNRHGAIDVNERAIGYGSKA